MKINSATLAFGGVTRDELRGKVTPYAKLIAKNVAYVNERWGTDLFPFEYADYPGYVLFNINDAELKDSSEMPTLLTWLRDSFHQAGIPYRLSIEVDLQSDYAKGQDIEYSTIWVPGQEAPNCFIPQPSGYFILSFLQETGLRSKDSIVDFVDRAREEEYLTAFRDYCIGLRKNLVSSLELNQLLGGMSPLASETNKGGIIIHRMKIIAARLHVGGMTCAELQQQSKFHAKNLAESLSYIKTQWLVDMIPEEYPDWVGHMWFIINASNLNDVNQLPSLLLWCTDKLREGGIPYFLDMTLALGESGWRGGMHSIMWLPDQKAPKYFTTALGYSAITFLQNAGLYPSDDGIEFIDTQKALERLRAFKHHCVDLHRNWTSNLELNRLLGG